AAPGAPPAGGCARGSPRRSSSTASRRSARSSARRASRPRETRRVARPSPSNSTRSDASSPSASPSVPLPRRFYLRPARAVARDLLGCIVVSRRGRTLTAGRIVETEAYLGPEDAASHAAFRPRSHALFYGDGGFAHVYLNYAIPY